MTQVKLYMYMYDYHNNIKIACTCKVKYGQTFNGHHKRHKCVSYMHVEGSIHVHVQLKAPDNFVTLETPQNMLTREDSASHGVYDNVKLNQFRRYNSIQGEFLKN